MSFKFRISIGSNTDSIWCLEEDEQIMLSHAYICQENSASEDLHVFVLNSNLCFGTWVNDEKVEFGDSPPMELIDGDTIKLGSSVFTVSICFLYNT